jgi:flagellar hook-length control protein FliK
MAFLLGLGVLGQIAGHLGSHHKHGIDPTAQTNPAAQSFGSVLNGQLDALGASDPLAQLTAIVQKGTPISTVADRLAHLVAKRAGPQADAVAKHIKSALSPPSNAPPGKTAAQQVAALARRLQTYLGGVARGADQRVGQKSDTSGQILDANRAKDIPAQHDPESVSSQLDVSALARSLLAQVAASFGPVQSAQTGAAATPLASSSAHEAVSAFSEAAKAQTSQASALARLQGALASAQSGNAPDASDAVNAASDPQSAAATTAPQPQTDPAGLLARMLMRAASVDARVNADAVSAAALGARGSGTQTAAAVHAVNGGASHGEGVNFAQTTAAARLEAALGDIVAASAQARNDNGSSDSDGGAAFRNASSSTADTPAASTKSVASVSDSLAFAVPAASPQTFVHTPASAANSAFGASVDPSAIVEQVVRSMAMRTQSDGTSEVRMRLVPEHLGSVTLSLKVDGSNVSATAVAQNADVRNALVSHQQQLARSLADAGLKLTGFTVNLGGGNAGHDQPRDRTSGFGRHYAVHEVTAAGQTDSTEGTSADPAILPQSTLALFNYLA